MECKLLDAALAEFKFDDAGNGSFSGYGSIFGNVDSQGDVVVKGAYADTLTTFLRDGFIAVGHDWQSTPVAYPTAAAEDDRGLKFSAAFHSTPAAQDARRVMQERIAGGKSVGLSIGYEVLDAKARNADGVRELSKLGLFEISIVTVPANRAALVTGAKSGLHAGLSLTDHSDSVLVINEEFVARMLGLAEVRAKDGRELSATNRARIAKLMDLMDDATASFIDVRADLAALLAATEPKPKAEGSQANALYAQFLRSMSA